MEEKREQIKVHMSESSITKMCTLLNLSKGGFYYEPVPISENELKIMDAIDRQYLKTPFYGSRKITVVLRKEGIQINRKRTQRLMRIMGLEAIYPKPDLSKKNEKHKVYPYLLRDVEVTRPNHAWAVDITYIRLEKGFCYLVAIIDLGSRYVLSWDLSTSLEVSFCIRTLLRSLEIGKPELFNMDQGSQFTCKEWISQLKSEEITISMDGKGRALDNIFIERFWRSLKYEEVYLKNYSNMKEAREEINAYIIFYNKERPHQSLNYKTPDEVYFLS